MVINQKQMTGNRYIGALLAIGVGIPIPILAVFFTLFGYFTLSAFLASSPPTIIPVLFLLVLGLIFTIIVWLLLAIFFMPVATARGGKLPDYELIQGELKDLRAQFDAMQPNALVPAQQPVQAVAPAQVAMAEIQSDLENIEGMLECNGLTWVMRTGYVTIWYQLNKADEAMIDILPREQVIEGANYDILSLTGSKVPNNKDLIEQLKKAINTLSSGSGRSNQSMAQALLAFLKKAVEQTGSPAETKNKEQEARWTIRKARAALHRFTNERWDALVRARNQLMGTALLVSIVTYILVVLAILKSVNVSVKPGVATPSTTLGQITLFYLVGAVVGIFSRALSESNAKDADIANMDDYGLTAARILVTPLLSGLAALVGVLLVAATISHSTMASAIYVVADVYNFNEYPQNLVLAAAFGYLPSLVIGLLQQQTNKIQREIQSSSPASGSVRTENAEGERKS